MFLTKRYWNGQISRGWIGEEGSTHQEAQYRVLVGKPEINKYVYINKCIKMDCERVG